VVQFISDWTTDTLLLVAIRYS